ncbi:KilA-N domain-containing protein [Methanoregula sp.]|jgi:KilA-N domain|uniref:KilA-N domain-containing protein n=1 Tax=Methanoregula sp. TaxID=2052170 RepID=UPI003C22574C
MPRTLTILSGAGSGTATPPEFLSIWEQLNNPDFNPVQFDGFRKQAGLNSFTLTPKQWIEMTHARGIVAKPGRYGGTYAHKDIAFEFAS